MPDTALASLTGASTLDGTELLYAVQGGADRKATVAQVKTWASNAPTLVTPALGVATATSINKVAITAPATEATLTIPDGVTLTGPASSGTAMTLGNAETVTGAKTFGAAGNVGKLKIAGATSGTITLDATATAGANTLTLPAATDTLVGKATTDTLTNKTFDTAGSGNSFSINGTAVSAVTGTGAAVLANTPTLITPNIGVATGTSLDVSGVLESGANSGTNGQLKLYGSTSGDVTIKTAAAAGTATVFQLPDNNGTVGYLLRTNGAGVTSWVAAAGTGDMLAANNLSDVASAATSFANIKQAASETATGVVELATDAETATGTDTARAITPANLTSAAIKQGKHTVWIPASAMVPRTTNGAASGTAEMTTNKNMVKTLDFDATTQEFSQFEIAMPKSWNESTVTFQPVWSHASTTTNFGVVWALQGVATSDDDALDVAFGTEQTSTDTGGTTNDRYIGPESSAITIGGTPAEGDVVQFQIKRNVSDGSDTMSIDARLHGVKLYITLNAATDA